MINKEFLTSLEDGIIRAASKINDEWIVDIEVKKRILDVFKTSNICDFAGGFRDKESLYTRTFNAIDQVRMVPGGTSVRAGTYIGKNVVIMPPSYINIGAYVDDDTMVDSHVLIGSCAQIGKRVHLSAAVQIGGVLEPIGSRPVIVEDDCFIGAGVILVEGILVRERAVLAPGVILSASIPIYDIVNNSILKGEIPTNAVVVPGTRNLNTNSFAAKHGLQIGCAVIIKYRDDKTNASIALEDALRT